MITTREELHEQITAYLSENWKGKACTWKHWDIASDLRKWARQNLGENFTATTSDYNQNEVKICYRDWSILRVELKRKKFQEVRKSYEAQFYYNDFVLRDINFTWCEECEKPEPLAETLQAIDNYIARSNEKKNQEQERH